MEREPVDAEALRRRLYRPGASAADLATYLDVAEGPTTAGPVPVPGTHPGPAVRPFVIGAACVAAAAVLGGLLLRGGLDVPSATVPATPIAAAASPGPTEGDDGSWRVTFAPAGMLDGGERDHARGVSVAEGPDRYRYTVAAGDTVTAIARRFTLCPSDVLVALPYGFDAGALPAAQTLELARLTRGGSADAC